MAKRIKSFRLSEAVCDALKQQAEALKTTEAWIVEGALSSALDGILPADYVLGKPDQPSRQERDDERRDTEA